jgi:hypothetical protein
MVSAADLLWAYDQKRARSLYWDVLNVINSTPEIRPAKEQLDKTESEKFAQAYSRVFSLKQQILRQVAEKRVGSHAPTRLEKHCHSNPCWFFRSRSYRP